MTASTDMEVFENVVPETTVVHSHVPHRVGHVAGGGRCRHPGRGSGRVSPALGAEFVDGVAGVVEVHVRGRREDGVRGSGWVVRVRVVRRVGSAVVDKIQFGRVQTVTDMLQFALGREAPALQRRVLPVSGMEAVVQ